MLQETVIYLVRHGVTVSNIAGTFQGKTDSPLDVNGIRQSELLGERFAQVRLDRIYASDLKRSIHTAEKVAERHQPPLHVQIEPLFREIDGGDLEGVTFEDNFLKYPQDMDDFYQRVGYFKAPMGESTEDVFIRMKQGVDKLLTIHRGEHVMIVTHGFALSTLVNHYQRRPLQEMPHEIYMNTSVTKVSFRSPEDYDFNFGNDFSHLSDEFVIHVKT